MLKMASRVLFVPANFDTTSYRSLERVESTTRAALASRFELVELDEHPGKDADAYLEAVKRAGPLDAIVDLSDYAAHGPMPGTPLMPLPRSPASARKSTSCSGRTPNFLTTSCG